jgi:hypothetical protein
MAVHMALTHGGEDRNLYPQLLYRLTTSYSGTKYTTMESKLITAEWIMRDRKRSTILYE